STTCHSEIPDKIKQDMSLPVILGVDEAGRGPVLGPMVYGIAYSLKDQALPGFDDSKVLKDLKRKELFEAIDSFNLGWATRTMTARDILSGMLRSSLGDGAYNLNAQAHDTTIQLIKEVLAMGVNVTEIFVDTVGPPVTYQAKLKSHFPSIDITVAKKADSIYPIVSAASVVAKVTRDLNLELYTSTYLKGHSIGSGYPSDPNTSKWLHANVDPVFGWLGLVRFLWQTAKDSLKNHQGVEVIYEEE
ncbi:ribonuclease HII/HIII, partial [Suhomyces tanzawaensis NRRL Y-17324]